MMVKDALTCLRGLVQQRPDVLSVADRIPPEVQAVVKTVHVSEFDQLLGHHLEALIRCPESAGAEVEWRALESHMREPRARQIEALSVEHQKIWQGWWMAAYGYHLDWYLNPHPQHQPAWPNSRSASEVAVNAAYQHHPPVPVPDDEAAQGQELQSKSCLWYNAPPCYFCCAGSGAGKGPNEDRCLNRFNRNVSRELALGAPRAPDRARDMTLAEQQQDRARNQLHPVAQPQLTARRRPRDAFGDADYRPAPGQARAGGPADNKESMARRTRNALRPDRQCEKEFRIGFIIGKSDDDYVHGQWIEDEGEQSDAAVASYIRTYHKHIDVVVCRPRSAKELESSATTRKLADCDVIHVLESEQFLPGHHYSCYRTLFHALWPYRDKIVPSLETMSFVMSKVDYLKVLSDKGIRTIPTFVFARPTSGVHFETQFKALTDFLYQQLDRHQPVFVTKPSHSGTRSNFSKWSYLELQVPASRERSQFLDHLFKMLVTVHKPYLLVQPFMADLALGEYRSYFVAGRFVTCVHTKWTREDKGEHATRLELNPVKDHEILTPLKELGVRIVGLLPKDSLMYRVDTFRCGGEWYVNEVEMVDASILPDYTCCGPDDVVVELAKAVVEFKPKAQLRARAPDHAASVAVLDVQPRPPMDGVRAAQAEALTLLPLRKQSGADKAGSGVFNCRGELPSPLGCQGPRHRGFGAARAVRRSPAVSKATG